jgi:hypothetical protein
LAQKPGSDFPIFKSPELVGALISKIGDLGCSTDAILNYLLIEYYLLIEWRLDTDSSRTEEYEI